MNTTDYFTNINAMFLFCIFTCGLLVWAVIRIYVLKSNMKDDLTTAYDRIKQADMDIANEMLKYDTLFKQHIERGKRIIALEVAKDNAEKESRYLRKQLDHAEADRIELRAERATLENKLTDALAKVRKRDKGGKFLPSGNGRPKRVKKGLHNIERFDSFKLREVPLIEDLQAVAAQPKLIHGLTVKNPTEDEAKMIFDEAMRLDLSTYAENRTDLPFIWWSVTDAVSRCADSDWPVKQIFVTAQEFVQRMQNGRR
jgi:hypothetical protein